MLPFQRKYFFSEAPQNYLFQMVSKIIVAEVTCLFFLLNQHKVFGKTYHLKTYII
jgi:hypothetical protein